MPDASAAAAAAAAARGGVGASGVAEGARLISSQVKAAQNLEFGSVTTTLAGDAMSLRRKLATNGSTLG